MKVGIIGAGGVGSATAFALIMRGVARKVVLIDMDKKRAQAEAMDIAHATPFAYASKVKCGSYEDLSGSEVVIITAGANQKTGESRIISEGEDIYDFGNMEKSEVDIIAEEVENLVYRTANGKRYHVIMTCGGSKSYGVSLEDAVASGLTPCDKCAK